MKNLTIRTTILAIIIAAFVAATLLAVSCAGAGGESETQRIYREYAECRDRAEPDFMDVESRIAILEGIEADPAEIADALAKCLARGES